MSDNFWNPFAAICTFLTLILTVIIDRKRIAEAFSSVRFRPIDILRAATKGFITVFERAWRPLVVILSTWWLVTWFPNIIHIQFQWGSFQVVYLFLIIPTLLLVYTLFLDPWIQLRKTKLSLKAINAGKLSVPVIPIVFYDDTIPCSWVEAPEKAASYFKEKGFRQVNVEELAIMMERAIKDTTAYKTLIVFIHDTIPVNIVQVIDNSCTLRRYLNAGGRVVWWGDIPLHVKGLPGNMKEQWAVGPAILSVNHYTPVNRNKETGISQPVLWSRPDIDNNIQLTDAGRAIGMTAAGKCVRPAAVDENTIVYSEICGDLGFGEQFKAFRWAISFRKVYNIEYPHSGFMQYPLNNVSGANQTVISDFFRFAVSDWPFAFTK
jgi:hypothetical protein